MTPASAARARRAVNRLHGLGRAKCETDTLTQCVMAARVDVAGFTEVAKVPLAVTLSAFDGFRAVLANLAGAISGNWQGTIDQSDPEFLHDLRVAVRRTRSVLAEGKTVLPVMVRDSFRDEFAWLASLTGPARDLDVYLLEWDRYTDSLADVVVASLAPVRALLERRRADAHVELEGALRSERAADLMSTWTTWLDEPVDRRRRPPRADRPIGRLVAKRVARAHAVLIVRGRLIDPDSPAEQVHDLRKDAKKLRYLLECFGSLLSDAPRKRLVKRLKVLQDNLGEHQDAEVHVALLREIAREVHDAGASPATMVAIGQLAERLDQQRIAARAEFAQRFADFDTRATRRSLAVVLDGISG